MKKWIAFMLVFVLAFVFAGCNNENGGKDDPKVPNASGIDITASKTEIDIEETITLTAVVKPEGAVQGVNWSSKNDTIATVDSDGKVTGVNSGTTQIVATAKSNNKIQKEINITVKSAPIVYDDPESVEIGGTKHEVTINTFITLTATVSPATADPAVTWSSSNTAIATVENGKVTGKALGTATITVTVNADTTKTDTWDITVVELYVPPVVVDPTSIVIQGEAEMQAGTSIYLTVSVLPTGVNQDVIWSSNKLDLATVTASGEVKAIKEGTVYITATSVVDEEIFETHKIVIKPAPVIEPYPDLGGYEILIMAAGHALYEHDPFDPDYTVLDKTAKQKAWQEVEKNFNAKLKVVAYPDVAPWGPQRIDWINANAAIGAAEMDIFVSTTDWTKQLADGNSVVDTLSFYQTYGQNSMSAAARGAATYQGALYALPTVAAAGLHVDKGLFYNVALLESLGLESPAKMFMEGRWTWSNFDTYVRNANAQLSAGQTVLSGRPALYWMGMVNAAGVKLADTVTLEMNFNHPQAIQAATMLRSIYSSIGWGTNAWDAGATSFNEGNSIFQSGDLWFVRTGNRWPSTLWDEGGNSRFGYVPYPYPDSMQRSNTRTVGAGGACYMMAAGRQYAPGVTAKDVYRAFTEMMLLTTKYMKEDPTYDEDQIMRLAAQNKVDDPYSVDALIFFKRDKVIFDPLYSILGVSSYIGPAIDQVVVSGADYNEILDAQAITYLARLLELYS